MIPREAQDHDERVDADVRAVRLRVTADLGPIALRLLAGRRLEPHGEGLVGMARGFQRLQEAPHDLR